MQDIYATQIAKKKLTLYALNLNFSLAFCGITDSGCDSLAKALTSSLKHLKELDLSYNHPGELGMKHLSSIENDPDHLTIRYS